MVSRDVDMRVLAKKKIQNRLCPRKETVSQATTRIKNTKSIIEPLEQLREYQEYNALEAIRERIREEYNELKRETAPVDSTKRKYSRSQTDTYLDNIQETRYERDRKIRKSLESSKSKTKYSPIVESNVDSMILGVCKESKLLDEISSYNGETDLLKIINVLREKPYIPFFYLTHKLPKRSTEYHYYNLKVAPYDKINHENYFTISLQGCTHMLARSEIEHITLDRFERDYIIFSKIRQIPTFARFRLWKGFTRWQKFIHYTKMEQCRRFLNDNLFVANSSLRPALLNIREMCHRISDMGLCKLEKGKTYTLLEFLTNQVSQMTEVCARLSEFRETVKEVVRSACRTALLEVGFVPDDYALDLKDSGMNIGRNLYDIEELVEGCKLTARFTRLEKIPYDLDRPLIGQNLKTVELGLLQIKNNQAKIERRFDKMKTKPQNPGANYSANNANLDSIGGGGGGQGGLSKDRMTFTEMAAKRNNCQRLTCFIRLADYLIVSTLHTLTVNSVYTLLDCLIFHLKRTPDKSEIATYQIQVPELTEPPSLHQMHQATNAMPRRSVAPVAQSPFSDADMEPIVPLFVLEVVVETNGLYLIPNQSQFCEGILEIIEKFQAQMFSIKNLMPDAFFDAFTRPFINRKHEEKTCGNGPQLQLMFAEDTKLKAIIAHLTKSLGQAFDRVTAYMATFAELQEFYKENEALDEASVKQMQDEAMTETNHQLRIRQLVAFYRTQLLKHHRQVIMTNMVPIQRPVGMFLVDSTLMRARLLPSPLRCIDLYQTQLPIATRIEIDRLVEETQDAESRLTAALTAPMDFVKLFEFLVHIQTRIDPMEKESDALKELYEVIDLFSVPIPAEDTAVYQTLGPSIERAKNVVDKVLSDRDISVDAFFTALDKDIGELMHDINEAKQAITNPVLLDDSADRAVVLEELEKMKQTTNDLQNRYNLCKEHHQQIKDLAQALSGNTLEDQILSRASVRATSFLEYLHKWFPNVVRVEQPRFEELEAIVSEMNLKQLLWDSLESWDEVYDSWLKAAFLKLNTDEMSAQLMKYVRSVTHLEKGLPPNNVVPLLRQKVDNMRLKVPAIMDMRNPTLKPRHWKMLEELLGIPPSSEEEPLSLGMLIDLEAFEKSKEIQEISGQASSEANLESLLKKVEDAWKSTEFTVVPYKDTKDVFILGGTDEIQQLWDDSNINIATIASSRFVGPIKSRVDDWTLQLELFGKTMDEWMSCQRSWLYLESIFSAPDIQRQLPSEAKSFMAVDKSYKEVMRKVEKVPLAMRAATQPGLLDTFRNNNQLLDQIQKCIEAYLESKRAQFPRFYFLSNDELLEILAQTRNPLAVQPHLRKCFDAIMKLDFALAPDSTEEEPKYSTDILAMMSPEGERVPLTKGLRARGNVEDWLGKVEEAMFGNLKRLTKVAVMTFTSSDRQEWLRSHCNQVVLTVEQLMWATDLTRILTGGGGDKVDDDVLFKATASYDESAGVHVDPVEGETTGGEEDRPVVRDVIVEPEDTDSVKASRLEELKEYETKCFQDLNQLASMVRGDLGKLFRAMLCSLITIDVHARDIVTELVANQVTSVRNFDWQRQLRYYWAANEEIAIVRMASSVYTYGYEYLGASTRLVITPLTDRCYLCLMGALQLNLGGAPAGPAGTGKTETTKDLAKSVAKQCVVFNCSDGLDYKIMGRFFSGLAQSGAWCCFDEFNRIDIEVLSVIAQQLITIRNAKAARVTRFVFEGREIKLIPTCAAFITMNPGYAGRTELPDNLKALFRPISMMVPDYRLIAEVILYSEGFESSKNLALKMTQMYKLCSEQLSQQDHYDFGMRAVKSVLVMAGSLKRQNPDKPEDVVLIRALRDSNLPKFLKQDAILFSAILQDLFPGVVLPEHDYGHFLQQIHNMVEKRGLRIVPAQVSKVIQFFETLEVRHGVMLVGPTGSGKTTVYRLLADVLTSLHQEFLAALEEKVKDEDEIAGEEDGGEQLQQQEEDQGVLGEDAEQPQPEAGATSADSPYQSVKTYVINPKAITLGELYGEVNKLTLEWHDGLLAQIVRQTCVDTSDPTNQWVICDGPVDAVWIENMNTVLDDNKMLCLANSERIKLTNYVHMLFEVQDLAVASPATVSRCGMVYVDPDELGWMPYAMTWLSTIESKITPFIVEYLTNMFETYVQPLMDFVMLKCTPTIPQVPIAKIQTTCKLLEVLLTHEGGPSMEIEDQKLKPVLAMTFIFALLWGLAGNLVDSCWASVDQFVRNLFDELGEARLPQHNDLWSCYVDVESRRMDGWEKLLTPFVYSKKVPFFDMIVPTTETIRFGHLLEKFLTVHQSVLFTGLTGVGKSVIARGTLNEIADQNAYVPVYINFSAQTSSNRLQEMIEAKLEKRKRNVRGAPKGKRVVILVDDLNMPKQDIFGCQPPIELLRQLQDFHGFYDRDKLDWIKIKDITLCAACGPPGGGRNPVSPRLIRHFALLSIPPPSSISLKQIFSAILQGFLRDFPQNVRSIGSSIVDAAVEIYYRMAKELLPTPAKSHYVFNLRDLSKCVQGVLQATPGTIRDKKAFCRLFSHEAQRVFHDRLTDSADKNFFNEMLAEISGRFFSEPLDPKNLVENPILFGDFGRGPLPREERMYEEFVSIDKLRSVMSDFLDEYNMAFGKEVKLVFFLDAIEHVCRIARMIRQDRGNALLVGVGGTGKQSLTRLAAHINDYQCFQIELTRGYDYSSFHDDLKKLYFWTAVDNKPTVFLFTDNQIVMEEFLEDINNILNSGEVPNLFENEEFERLIIGCREAAKKTGIAEGNREAIFEFAINRVRNNLHIVLCMSPAGSSFRIRCRMFPSLVNCCTIDWFVEWPEEALFSVAMSTFASAELLSDDLKESIARISTDIHLTVSTEATRFFKELGRRYYTTPTSYLELLTLYMSMMNDKMRELSNLHDKFKNGLDKLFATNDLVASMETELTALRPTLETKQRDTERLMVRLSEDQEQVDIVRNRVREDEAVAKAKAAETQAIAEDAQRDLNEAVPALEAANRALDSLDKNDISEIRVFTKPPQLVQTVLEAVCLMLGQKPDWATAKTMLGDSNFLKKLMEYPKDDISDLLLKKLTKYIENPDFIPEIVEKTSKACKSMCMWVRALDLYARVYRTVEPKRKRLAAANTELEKVMLELRKKQAELGSVEQKIAELQAEYTTSVSEKKKLEHHLALTAARLKRAARLTTALADEQERWSQSVVSFKRQMGSLQGDVLIAAACVAYVGAFNNEYRQRLLTNWIERCRELSVPVSDDVDLFAVLGDAYELRQWNSQGLPRDQFSTDNAILVTRSRRWPLMIDPQDQANRWIKALEADNKLRLTKLTDPRMLRILESSIQVGFPVLIEDVGESLDPALEPILLRQTFMSGGRLLIRLGDTDVEYGAGFRLYITTKLANPHYLPEVAIKVTLINFTVTPTGLEDQLLGDVTGIERPDLEEQRTQLIVRINADKGQLKDIENRILELLHKSEGNILDNEVLINTLNESKVVASEIGKRLAEATVTEQKIGNARLKYAPIAARGSVMYFVITKMAEIDPMYQYSLKYFTNLFNSTIKNAPHAASLDERIQRLLNATTSATYTNVARGLFARDKLIFSFMLCAKIMLHEGEVGSDEWSYFLAKPSSSSDAERASQSGLKDPSVVEQPAKTTDYLTSSQWQQLTDLSRFLPNPFSQLVEDLTKIDRFALSLTMNLGRRGSIEPPPTTTSSADTEGSRRSSTSSTSPGDKYTPTVFDLIQPSGQSVPEQRYNHTLTLFQKLLLVQALSEESVIPALIDLVRCRLGPRFVEPPPIGLNQLFPELTANIPLVFVLSPGSDPMSQLQRFAKEQGRDDKLQSVSLGQGQGPMAEALIKDAYKDGNWVFLQNCHLAASWMVKLEQIVKDQSADTSGLTACHPDYRLFLSSMPTKVFPISILQNSVKVTNEPPKGLRANINRALNDLSANQFETHFLGLEWRKLVTGICFFHAIILERKKFGPLGWNIGYDFNDSDRECALLNLDMYCQSGKIPWDALIYINAEITYGGRVTDFWDQRCLRTILTRFFHPDTLTDGYVYSQSGLYYAPETETLEELKTYASNLPFIDQPEVFGMHENANLVYQLQETHKLIASILGVEPRLGDVTSGKTPDETVHELASHILSKVPTELDLEKARPELFETDEFERVESLTTVLRQEVDRFNKLLGLIRQSLQELQKAIKGLVVMSEELEQIYQAFIYNQVPDQWANCAYPSLKPLGSWVIDLVLRCEFINAWLTRGAPRSFWLSGFFFPQGFLTGTLQTYARKYNHPIDHLSFECSVLGHYRDQHEVSRVLAHTGPGQELSVDEGIEKPEDGVLVHGLFMDGFRWDDQSMQLADSIVGETSACLPMLHMHPHLDYTPNTADYAAPLYKTSARAGVLSTTGHSTNFVVEIYLPHSKTSAHWIEMGAALLCMQDN